MEFRDKKNEQFLPLHFVLWRPELAGHMVHVPIDLSLLSTFHTAQKQSSCLSKRFRLDMTGM